MSKHKLNIILSISLAASLITSLVVLWWAALFGMSTNVIVAWFFTLLFWVSWSVACLGVNSERKS